MPKRKSLFATLPYPVEQALKKLGANLRTARLRRNLTLEEVAEKIGFSRWVVAHAENGKPSTGIAIYLTLLWVYGLIDQIADIADPTTDEEGQALALSRERSHAYPSERLDNDF